MREYPMRTLYAFLLLTLLVACVPVGDRVLGTTEVVPETIAPTARFTVEGMEGDLIALNPQAVDPDGDYVTYTYTQPFDDAGQWQTKLGDEGEYVTTITADDSRGGFATESVLVLIHHTNRAPVITCEQNIVVQETAPVDLNKHCTVTDEDSPEVHVTYSGWMTTATRTTSYNDAGAYEVTLTATDGEATTSDTITVVVQNLNRPPTFGEFPTFIRAVENDVITLPLNTITDPDGDRITVTFSDPFNKNGVWKSGLGDAGTYDVDVVATDGEASVKKTVRIELVYLNTAPTLKPVQDIVVGEGETIYIPVSATDRENDELITTISGWMNTREYTTTYDDAGEYTVTVTVSDGELEDSNVIHVTVQDRNRPPYFTVPA